MLRTTLLGAAAVLALSASAALAQTTTPPATTPAPTPAPAEDAATTSQTAPTPDSTSADQPASTPTDTAGQAGSTEPAQSQPMATPQAAPMASSQPSGGAAPAGMTNVPGGQAADTAGFAPRAPDGATEEQVVQGDGQLEQSSVNIGGTTVNVTANTPVPNPPENVGSSSPGRGAGREGAAPRRARR